MSRRSNKSDRKALFLRRDAENRLKMGTAPASTGLPLDRDALGLLYAMASDPHRSSDALRLLQELQVHQVEIDLQREELENNERETSRELALYQALFELTPTAFLATTAEGRIVESNPAAATLFNTGHGELAGRTLLDFVTLHNPAAWSGLLWKLKSGKRVACCDVRVSTGEKAGAALSLSAHFSPEGDLLLLTLAHREPAFHDSSKQE